MLDFLESTYRSLDSTAIKNAVASAFSNATFESEQVGERTFWRVKCYCINVTQIPTYESISESVELINVDLMTALIAYRNAHKDNASKFPGNKLIKDDQLKQLMFLRQQVQNGRLKVQRERKEYGRFYSKQSMSNLCKLFRSTLFKDKNYVDLDQQKSCCTILHILASLSCFPMPYLLDFIENPTEFILSTKETLSADLSNDDIKNLVTRLCYGGTYERWVQLMEAGSLENDDYSTTPKKLATVAGNVPIFIQTLNLEIIQARKAIAIVNERALSVLNRNETDKGGIAKLFQIIENHINFLALQFLQSDNCYEKFGFQVTNEYVWSWDGLSFVKNDNNIDFNNVCAEINNYVHEHCGDSFRVLKYVVKPYEEYVINITSNFNDEPNNVFTDNPLHNQMLESRELQYDDWKEWFQKEYTVFRIFKKIPYYGMRNLSGAGYVLVSRTTLASMFCDFQYTVLTKKKGKKGQEDTWESKYEQAITKWLNDSDKYIVHDFDPYPPPKVCPANVINSWIDSPYENFTFTPNIEAVEQYKKLLNIMCGYVENQYNWMEWWLAHTIQRPGEKPGFVPVLMGSEGLGKSFFCSWTMKIMGKDRSAAVRFDDIVGRFNVILSSKYFIVVNEFPQNMSVSQAEAFRSVTADEDISVEEKNVQSFNVKCFSRFICNCNNDVDIQSNRRPNYLQPSAEYFGRYDIFDSLRKFTEDENALACVYNYYRTINIQERFGLTNSFILQLPDTEFNRKKKRSIALDFALFLCETTAPGKDYLHLTNGELKYQFDRFAKDQGWGQERIAVYSPSKIIGILTQHTWKMQSVDRCIYKSFPSNEVAKSSSSILLPGNGGPDDNRTNKIWDLKMIREEFDFIRNLRQRLN